MGYGRRVAGTKKLFAALTRRGPHRVLRGDLAFAGLPGVVYTPESGFNLPGVAFGHEWLTAVDRYAGTLEHLASWGIVAAAPDTETRRRAVGAEPGVRPGHHARHHRRCAAGRREDQRAPHQARRGRARVRRVGGGVRRGRACPGEAEGCGRGVPDGHQAARRGGRRDAEGARSDAHRPRRSACRCASNAVELARRLGRLRRCGIVEQGRSPAGWSRGADWPGWSGCRAPTAAPRRWCGRC